MFSRFLFGKRLEKRVRYNADTMDPLTAYRYVEWVGERWLDDLATCEAVFVHLHTCWRDHDTSRSVHQDKTQKWSHVCHWDFQKRIAVLPCGVDEHGKARECGSTELIRSGVHVLAVFANPYGDGLEITAKVLKIWWDLIGMDNTTTRGAAPMFRPLDAAERAQSTKKQTAKAVLVLSPLCSDSHGLRITSRAIHVASSCVWGGERCPPGARTLHLAPRGNLHEPLAKAKGLDSEGKKADQGQRSCTNHARQNTQQMNCIILMCIDNTQVRGSDYPLDPYRNRDETKIDGPPEGRTNRQTVRKHSKLKGYCCVCAHKCVYIYIFKYYTFASTQTKLNT